MDIFFATHNAHKAIEVREIIGQNWHLKSLVDLGQLEEIPETSDTLKGNALQKAQYVFDKYHVDCFADDTGMEIDALDGRPGVYSARYAGEHCSYMDNVNKVLKEMEGKTDRRAHFTTVIALILNGETYYFEGRVDGVITEKPCGEGGFGYDPIFKPDGYDKTFAELDADEKNRISHRGIAMKKLKHFLSQNVKM